MKIATRFFIIMGVSGSGKSAVGSALAKKLGWPFFDADNYHPAENIEKMANGIPLTDEDRQPWLISLRILINDTMKDGGKGVLACSALKEKYRQILLSETLDVKLVNLKGSYDLIWSRMAARADHYMQPSMLQSQFATLEEPLNALTVEITPSVDEIVSTILLDEK